MKKSILFLLSIVLLCYIFLCPQDAVQASLAGVRLWFYTLLPSLLPFIILSNLLIQWDKLILILRPFDRLFRCLFGLSSLGGYAMLIGVLCGCPMGAKVTADLYREGKIDIQEADYLLSFANNTSPVFLSNYIYLHILDGSVPLMQINMIYYSAILLTSLTFRLFYRRFHTIQPGLTILPNRNQIFIKCFDSAVMNGFETIAKLGGYVILFSIISHGLLNLLPASTLSCFLAPFIEVTSGLDIMKEQLHTAHSLPFFAMIFVSFGGISIMAQTKGMLVSTLLHLHNYIIGKLVTTLYCALLSWLFFII